MSKGNPLVSFRSDPLTVARLKFITALDGSDTSSFCRQALREAVARRLTEEAALAATTRAQE